MENSDSDSERSQSDNEEIEPSNINSNYNNSYESTAQNHASAVNNIVSGHVEKIEGNYSSHRNAYPSPHENENEIEDENHEEDNENEEEDENDNEEEEEHNRRNLYALYHSQNNQQLHASHPHGHGHLHSSIMPLQMPLPLHSSAISHGIHPLSLHNNQSNNNSMGMHQSMMHGGLTSAGISVSQLMAMSGHNHMNHNVGHHLSMAPGMELMSQAMQVPQIQPISYVGRSFASEKDLRIWVAQEFGGLVNVHGKKFWRSGDNLAKYKNWTCSCKHEKKAGCKFKLYIAWTNKSVGPVIKTSNAVHSGHPVDMREHRRSEYGIDGDYGQSGISEEVYAKIITSMQNRENQCKKKLAYNYCTQAFEKFLNRELDLAAPLVVRRKVNDFIAAASTVEPPAPPYITDAQQYHMLQEQQQQMHLLS